MCIRDRAGFDVQMRAMDDAGIAAEGAAGNYNMLYIYWTRADPSPPVSYTHLDVYKRQSQGCV